PAQDEVALFLERHQVRVELGQKAELGLLPFLSGRAAGEVGADDGELALRGVEAQFHIAALCIEFGRAVTDHHIARFVPGVNRHTRITLFFGQLEMPLEARQFFEASRQVRGLGLDLLHANTIGAMAGQPAFDPLAGGGAVAVEIEAGEFEQGSSPWWLPTRKRLNRAGWRRRSCNSRSIRACCALASLRPRRAA